MQKPSFLSKLFKRALLLLPAFTCVTASAQQTDVVYEDGVRYSELIINSRLTDFYCNKNIMGMNAYTAKGAMEKKSSGNMKFDYVIGLVAKSLIEAVDYYYDQSFALPWYYSVENYANTFAGSVPTTGGSLDNLNASKMYITLATLSAPGGKMARYADASTYSNAQKAMQRAAKGLADTQKTYSITAATDKETAGGWHHKSNYPNQMWCDGQYMGPALLAQLLTQGYGITSDPVADWQTIMLQFDITWSKLWDSDKQLLWHAFSASPKDSYANCWADPVTGRSKEYWGRALGWYFLALVDVLELMPDNITMAPRQQGLSSYPVNCRERMMQYLSECAAGLARWQDAASGCWYQLLAHDGSFHADTYRGRQYADTYNYLESSATALFAAAYLKALRLNMLPENVYGGVAERAYKGFVNEFVKKKADGTYTLVNSCASAGLGGSDKRDGTAEYYLLGGDVTRVTTYTEGKVLGAFILASVEWERRHASASGIAQAATTAAPARQYDLQGRRATPSTRLIVSNGTKRMAE